MTAGLRLGIVGGAGWLGQAMAAGTSAAGLVNADSLTLSYRSQATQIPARWTRDNQQLADQSDVIILSVRPQDWREIDLDLSGKLVISVMAGISIARLAERHGSERIIRAMPNGAASVGMSYTPWTAAPDVSFADRQLARAIFATIGEEDELEAEREIDYFAGLSGSGPAFPALLASAMLQDAVAKGIQSKVALRAVTTLLVGTGRLLEQNPQHPDGIVSQFLDYRGTTAAAINAMREAGFDEILATGLSSAFEKSRSMEE